MKDGQTYESSEHSRRNSQMSLRDRKRETQTP